MDMQKEVFKAFITGCTDEDLPIISYFDAGISFPDIADFNIVADMIVDELLSRKLSTRYVFQTRDLVINIMTSRDSAHDRLIQFKTLMKSANIGNATDAQEVARIVTDVYNAVFPEDVPESFQRQVTEISTARDIPLPSEYSWSEKAELLYAAPDGELTIVYPFPIFIKEIRINKDTGDEQLCITFKSDGEYKSIVLDPEEVYDGSGLRKLNSKGAVISRTTAKALSDYFLACMQELRYYIKRQYVTKRIGWVGDGFDEFMPYTSAMLYDDSASFQREFGELLKSRGTLDGWTQLIGPYRDEHHIPFRIILAASFASVLVKKLSPQPFFVHLWGPSGTGKSVALRVAASVWANPETNGYGFIKILRGSIEALDQLAQFFNNLPLCLDDRENTASSGETLSSVVYNLATGAPKPRALAGGGIREQYGWCNAILTNGEHKMIGFQTGGGAENRVLEIGVDGPVIETSKAAYTDFNRALDQQYNTAGRAFINCLIQKGAMDEADALYRVYENCIQNYASGRQTGAAAIILTADTLVSKWIFHDDVRLTPEDIIPYLKSEDEIDQALQIHEKLYDWIVAHPSYFDVSHKGMRYGQRVIRRRTNKKAIAFIPDMLNKVIKHLGGTLGSYLAWASKHGYLELDAKGNNTIVVELKNALPNPEGGVYEKKQYRCYCIAFDAENLEAEEDPEELDESEKTDELEETKETEKSPGFSHIL